MEDFRRPDHPDFQDSSELAKAGFSGMRHNSISDYVELWVDGVKKMEMLISVYRNQPELWASKYSEVFGLKNVEVLQTKEKGN